MAAALFQPKYRRTSSWPWSRWWNSASIGAAHPSVTPAKAGVHSDKVPTYGCFVLNSGFRRYDGKECSDLEIAGEGRVIVRCSRTPEEQQVQKPEHQNDADVHRQPFPESVSQENEIDADDEGHHRRAVKGQGDLPFMLISPPKARRAPRGAGALFRWNRSRGQAATWSICAGLLPVPIEIVRGFMASGILRTRSTCRSPFSRLAPFTST